MQKLPLHSPKVVFGIATLAGLMAVFLWNRTWDGSRIQAERLLSRETGAMMHAVEDFRHQTPESQRHIVEELRKTLRESEDAKRRFRAALALHQLEAPGVEADFLAALDDPAPDVRASAATSLGLYGYRPAIQPLIEHLRDPVPVVRRSAAFALGELECEPAIEGLVSLLQDSEWDVRRSAVQALTRIRSERASAALQSLPLDLMRDELVREFLRSASSPQDKEIPAAP